MLFRSLLLVPTPPPESVALPRNCESDISASCGCLDPSAPRTAARSRSLCDVAADVPSRPFPLDRGGSTCRSSVGLSLIIPLRARADFAWAWLNRSSEFASEAKEGEGREGDLMRQLREKNSQILQ